MNETMILRECNASDERGQREGPVDIVVRAGRIAEITPAGSARSMNGARELDARHKTVVPGLVNMHEHLSNAHPGTLEERAIEGEDELGRALRMAGNALKALRGGVTSMRLVGEKDATDIRVRDAIAEKKIDGPRIWTACAPLDYVGGHGGTVGALEADSPEDFGRLAEAQVAAGADLLKLMICGGGAGKNLEQVRFTPDEFAAIRAVARDAQLKMSLHTAAVPDPIMDQVLADGQDSLEHCYLMSEDMLSRCIERQILLVMTPLVGRSPEYFEAIQLPRDMIDRLTEAGKTHWNVICMAVREGALLALGTDFHSHLRFGGTSAPVRELELYEEAGADPRTILALASKNGAAWLGCDQELGLVEEGFLADLLILGRDPFDAGASAFRDLHHVIADGKVFEPHAPEEPGVAAK
jgi:imidazolonepropionase-like amidohydrolase